MFCVFSSFFPAPFSPIGRRLPFSSSSKSPRIRAVTEMKGGHDLARLLISASSGRFGSEDWLEDGECCCCSACSGGVLYGFIWFLWCFGIGVFLNRVMFGVFCCFSYGWCQVLSVLGFCFWTGCMPPTSFGLFLGVILVRYFVVAHCKFQSCVDMGFGFWVVVLNWLVSGAVWFCCGADSFNLPMP